MAKHFKNKEMTQPIEAIQNEQEKRRLISLLNKIASSAEFGVIYQAEFSVQELKDKFKDIQEIAALALKA